MALPPDSLDQNTPQTLSSAGLPRRVRRILERVLALYTEELERNLAAAVSEFEEELFRFAERSGGPTGALDHMQSLRSVRLNRHDLIPRFMHLLESDLAGLRRRAQIAAVGAPTPLLPGQTLSFRNLSLVENSVMDEGAVLHEIATRQESRSNLILHLVGQRFGVLAAAPAFDGERLPVGAQALCRAIRHASQCLQLEHEARLLFYRIFDRRVMAQFPQLVDKLDAILIEENVLPGLTYVPMRSRGQSAEDELEPPPRLPPRERTPPPPGPGPAPGGALAGSPFAGVPMSGGAPAAAAALPGTAPASPQRPMPSREGGGSAPAHIGYDPQRPHTSWMGQAPPGPAFSPFQADEQAAYQDLQKLLGNHRRQQEAKRPPGAPPPPPAGSLPTRDVLHALNRLEVDPNSPGVGINLSDIKQTLLAQGRQQQGRAVALSQADNDTFDLLGLLYNHLHGELRADAPATSLLKRLQVTLLRVALQDHSFFVRPAHPARQLLNTVAETSAKWLAEDDFDPQLLTPLQEAVTHAVKNFDGDVSIFEESNKRLQNHVDTQVRRAESLEKRHIEAARGKEKLEVAKQRAERTLAELTGSVDLPKFTRALLNQAWADVLTLTGLRHGEGSEEWNRQIDATKQIVEACTHRHSNDEHPELRGHIETALRQVGYHEDEAEVIARRLSSSHTEEEAEADGASRTELTMKLKARTRLGEDMQRARKPDLPPRTPQEQECYERLRLLPFGTWLEFVTNQQGDAVRRRMSWFSPVTDNALFVNQRGQRIGEHSMDSLARMMAKDQVRVVTVQRASLVDRAWSAAVNALRSIAGGRREDDEDEAKHAAAPPSPTAHADGEPPPGTELLRLLGEESDESLKGAGPT
jgi:hypothetical protein